MVAGGLRPSPTLFESTSLSRQVDRLLAQSRKLMIEQPTKRKRLYVNPMPRMVVAAIVGVLLGLFHTASGSDCPPDWEPAFPYSTELYPFSNRCLELSHGTLHYLDESPVAEPQGVVLLLHGNPTWSFLYRDIALALIADGYRLIAPDLYGFGLSDKPPLSQFGYRPSDQTDIVEQFLLALDLQGVTFVLHDWGGPIGISLADRHSDRVIAFVIMNTFLQSFDADDPGVNHLVVDFSLKNIANEQQLRESGVFPRQTGTAIASLFGAPGTPEFEAVQHAYWGPFLELDTGAPLSPDIVAPTNIFAQNLLLSSDFLDSVDVSLHGPLSELPLYMIYSRDDSLYGALRCDPDGNPVCPVGTGCVSLETDDYCLTPEGGFVYPYIDRLRSLWRPDKITGLVISDSARHLIQEWEVAAVVSGIETVIAAARSGFILNGPDPGLPGESNTLQATQVEPGHNVLFLGGIRAGQTVLPGCDAISVNLQNPRTVGAAVADAQGVATVQPFLPGFLAGLGEIRFQAIDLAGCAVSNVRFVTFPDVADDLP